MFGMFAEAVVTCHDGLMKRSGDYPENILDPGEEILIHERPHWISLAGPTLVGVAVVMVMMLLLGFADALNEGVLRTCVYIVIAVCMVGLLIAWTFLPALRWLGSSIVVTSDRLIFRQGIIRKETSSVSLAWIQAVEVKQFLLGRMMHYGTIHTSSYELGGLRFDRVPHPHDVESAIRSGATSLHQSAGYPQQFYYMPAEGYPAYPPVGVGYGQLPPLATYRPPQSMQSPQSPQSPRDLPRQRRLFRR